MIKLLGTTLVSVFLAATSASVAMAQTAANPNPSPAAGPMHRFAEGPFSRPTERIDARLAYLKTALKITDAQQAQWDAYAGFARKNAQDLEQRFQAMHSGGPGHMAHQRGNAIERLEKTQAFHAEAIARINQLLAVQKPLYAALSPEQQKVADVVLNRRNRSTQRPPMHGHGGFGKG